MNTATGFSALKNGNIRWSALGSAFFTFGNRALGIVIAFQIYQITHSALALGWLGLMEAIPAITVAPFGGHVADNFNRHRIIMTTRAICFICALALAILSRFEAGYIVILFYTLIFIFGFARGFTDPAMTAFESQIVPKDLIINASSWFGSVSITSSILGQAASGFIFAGFGATVSYMVIAGCFIASFFCVAFITPEAQVKPEKDERVFESIKIGWKALYHIQPLFAAMALDMIAVLFGGMTILLPIFANDILKIGAGGYGLLNATISVGALGSMLLAMTYSPVIKKAGKNLLISVTAFGVCIIVFAFSTQCLAFGGYAVPLRLFRWYQHDYPSRYDAGCSRQISCADGLPPPTRSSSRPPTSLARSKAACLRRWWARFPVSLSAVW